MNKNFINLNCSNFWLFCGALGHVITNTVQWNIFIVKNTECSILENNQSYSSLAVSNTPAAQLHNWSCCMWAFTWLSICNQTQNRWSWINLCVCVLSDLSGWDESAHMAQQSDWFWKVWWSPKQPAGGLVNTMEFGFLCLWNSLEFQSKCGVLLLVAARYDHQRPEQVKLGN